MEKNLYFKVPSPRVDPPPSKRNNEKRGNAQRKFSFSFGCFYRTKIRGGEGRREEREGGGVGEKDERGKQREEGRKEERKEGCDKREGRRRREGVSKSAGG